MKKVSKGKKVVIFSLKGGQGKTTISLALAQETGFGVITNDFYSPLQQFLPKERILKLEPDQDLPNAKALKEADVIFDYGGYLDKRLIPALEMSDCVGIPVTEFGDLETEGFVHTVDEVKRYNKNIFIILNKIDDETADQVRTELKKNKYPYPVFEIKKSKVFQEIRSKKKAMSEILKEGGLKKYMYTPVYKQLSEVIKHIKNTK
jgi:cellulose biosynthesis protein BcsQ